MLMFVINYWLFGGNENMMQLVVAWLCAVMVMRTSECLVMHCDDCGVDEDILVLIMAL